MSLAAPVYLNCLGLVCALGADKEAVRAALFATLAGGVTMRVDALPGRDLSIGSVDAQLASLDALPPRLRSRNNALFLSALGQIRSETDAAIARFGPDRVGIVVGTSTSGIAEGERAIAHYRDHEALPDTFHLSQQEMGSAAEALSAVLGIGGPAIVVSTACSSSAKALASAARLLRAGICDAVVTGGMDSVCSFTLAGFAGLESISVARCNPMSLNRAGINIGEGGALFLMTREPAGVRLSGWGESSDAHHISAPAPDARGALASMREALARAELAPQAIDYINMHGTATPQNDAMESLALDSLFGLHVPVSSTKPLTGHTLGGAGALEAALCWLTLTDNPDGLLPPHFWDGVIDPALPAVHLTSPGDALGRPIRHVLSNSFAFGGSNATLILSALSFDPLLGHLL